MEVPPVVRSRSTSGTLSTPGNSGTAGNDLPCFARAPGFEPGSKVLETSILPLNYARFWIFACELGCRLIDRGTGPANTSIPISDKVPGEDPRYFAKIKINPHIRQRGIAPVRPGGIYFRISVTWPAPTVRPPSRIANFRPFSIAMGWISLTVRPILSPGITISVPAGSSTSPVTSVVRK